MISPIMAAVLCMKPRPLLTPRQAIKVRALKQTAPDFVAMRAFRDALSWHYAQWRH
jgi:hypothetical protein